MLEGNYNNQKKYHYIYKTTNKVNNKYYIGMHSTNKMDDGYLGSGRHLTRAIRKYGKEHFVKEILQHCNSRVELIEIEKQIVNSEVISDPYCMNIMEGGQGGLSCTPEQYKQIQAKASEVRSYKAKHDPVYQEMLRESGRKKMTDLWDKPEFREKKLTEVNGFQGKTHTEETKTKMRESRKGNGSGSSNSQFGTCWITKNGINKKIDKLNLPEYISQGWISGRKIRLDK